MMSRRCFVLFAMLLVLLACGSPGPDAETRAALVGVWQDQSMDEILELTEDGEGTLEGTLWYTDVRYKWVSEAEIEIDYSPQAARANIVRYRVKVDADMLELTWQEGQASYTQTYKRVK